MAQVKKAIVRDAIMRAAFDLFSQKDYAATSLVEIADTAGVSPASLYVYFPSKFKILWAVLHQWLAKEMNALVTDFITVYVDTLRILRLSIGEIQLELRFVSILITFFSWNIFNDYVFHGPMSSEMFP